MMMMRTGRIAERGAMETSVQGMAMIITTVRMRRTHRVVRNVPGKRREQIMGRGNGRGKGRGTGGQWRK